MSATGKVNPLHLHGALPRFDLFETELVVPGVRELLVDLETHLAALEADLKATNESDWSSLIDPLETLSERLGFAWGLVGHLMGVQNSETLREAHSSVQAEVVGFGLRLAQSRPIFEALESLRAADAFRGLEPAQQRIIESLLREARHAGVGLADRERERFNEIQAELADLGTRFSNHVLDATKAFGLVLREPDEIAGAPESVRQLAAQNAREHGEKDATPEQGPWRITLDAPVLMPFLEHGERRDLREQLYRAYVTRASAGDLDNTPLIARILVLRQEMAGLLGFESYAALSLDSKMAADVAAVGDLLEALRTASIDAAREDLVVLQRYANEIGLAGSLRLWDVGFYSERLREARFDYSEEELRPYFPMPRVLEGLFALAGRLFGVSIEAADGETTVWHPDVRFFRVRDEAGKSLAAFFLDPYSRPGDKRGGAWMDECLGRTGLGSEAPREAVAYLVCNQTPPVGDRPSLMSFDEVLTLFHEFGHGLQHMLTRVDYGLASGIRNIEWDAVELPSQFMENWCYHRETLLGLSGHFETGEPLPVELFEKIEAARTFRAGSAMLRQIYFATMDIELHSEDLEQSGESVFDIQRRVAERTTVLPPLAEDRFLCSFGHIFAGGYAAGYYSYKWAEVLSADAFSAFEEAGLEDAAAVSETGRRFLESVLALGGGTPPMEVFKAFRGREPSPDALLRHSGLMPVR
ncbi:MAG: M3 family metallopeptidase [Deltaproteobacteria bacterium]|nr:M3 family metallopeptidase [Deltaproteobacteria bacterium]